MTVLGQIPEYEIDPISEQERKEPKNPNVNNIINKVKEGLQNCKNNMFKFLSNNMSTRKIQKELYKRNELMVALDPPPQSNRKSKKARTQVPHALTGHQQNHRYKVCTALFLKQIRNEPFQGRILTCDGK